MRHSGRMARHTKVTEYRAAHMTRFGTEAAVENMGSGWWTVTYNTESRRVRTSEMVRMTREMEQA